MDMLREGRLRRVVLLAAGTLMGAAIVGTPVGAHVGGTITHLWNHLKPKADVR
jgi:hypothetical protein